MKKVVYYCSWGGFGHIARAYSISRFLDNSKVYVCSAQKWVFEPLRDLKYIKLSEPTCRVRFESDKITKQEYKPGGDISEYTDHLQEFFEVLRKIKPDVVVIDNPAELALMCKLMGYKTIVVYETLKTDEFRWELTWSNVDKILVPYTKVFADDCGFKFADNAFFAGGFSRFEQSRRLSENQKTKLRKTLKLDADKKTVFLTFGKGALGQEIFDQVVKFLSSTDHQVLFASFAKNEWSEKLEHDNPNLKIIYGQTNLLPYYEISDFVISGAGYNSVMEPLEAGCPSIFIPLERIYGEQQNKAETIEKIGAGFLINVSKKDWLDDLRAMIEKVSSLDLKEVEEIVKNQKKVADGKGSERAAKFIEEMIDE